MKIVDVVQMLVWTVEWLGVAVVSLTNLCALQLIWTYQSTRSCISPDPAFISFTVIYYDKRITDAKQHHTHNFNI